MSLSKAQQVIREQNDRISYLEDIEERYHRLQRDYDRIKGDASFSKQMKENFNVNVIHSAEG